MFGSDLDKTYNLVTDFGLPGAAVGLAADLDKKRLRDSLIIDVSSDRPLTYRLRRRQTCSDGKRLAQSAVTVSFGPVADSAPCTSM